MEKISVEQNIPSSWALVTGASRGLGKHICIALNQRGINIIGMARSKQGLNDVEALCKNKNAQMISLAFDLSQTNQIAAFIKEHQTLFARVDILINNAGFEKYSAIDDYDHCDLVKTLNVNLLAPAELIRCLIPTLKKFKASHIINIASLAGKKGVAYNSAYSASKGGLVILSDSLRQELKNTSVKVSVLCPGYVKEEGMFASGNVEASPFLSSAYPKDIGQAVVNAIHDYKSEIYVKAPVIKFLLALSQMFPRFADFVVDRLGVNTMNKKRAEAIKKQHTNEGTL